MYQSCCKINIIIISIISIISLLSISSISTAPLGSKSVKSKNSDNDNKTESIGFFDELNQHNYAEYMKEVFKELEQDANIKTDFNLTNATQSLEAYANLLNQASLTTRTKLDDIKRREIKRLNNLEKELQMLTTNTTGMNQKEHDDTIKEIILQEQGHIFKENANSKFTIDDLKALIGKIQSDIETADRVREREYRRHEMKKERDRRKKLRSIEDPQLRAKLEAEYREARKQHLIHKKLHEPGSLGQMKEVWETEDHMDPEEFDPKTFFNIHDLNQDNHWDINEVEAVVQKDIAKVYKANDSFVDDDEKFHETMRMRKHIMEKIDANKDHLISLDEFINYSKSSDFSRDTEWKTGEEVDEPSYTEEDFKRFEEEMEKLKHENKIEAVEIKEEPHNTQT